MFRKFIITFILSLSIFVLCSVPSYASTMTEQQMAIEQIRLCWQTSTSNRAVVSFDTLTSLCADLNRGGYPCEIRFVSALNGYYILGTGYVHNTYESSRVYSLSGKYYSNIEGCVFYTPYQSDSLLSGISTYVSSISSQFSTVTDRLSTLITDVSSISDNFNSLMADNGYLRGFYNSLNSIDSLSSNISSLFDILMAQNGYLRGFYNSFDSIESRLDTILGKLGSSSGSDLTTLESTVSNIESTLSIINGKLDNTATSIENTTVNITNNNPAYNVFYVTDENGEEHSITSVAADSLSASGKLLQFLYKLIVDGALSGVDSAVDGLNDFFFDSSPGSIVEGGSVWD